MWVNRNIFPHAVSKFYISFQLWYLTAFTHLKFTDAVIFRCRLILSFLLLKQYSCNCRIHSTGTLVCVNEICCTMTKRDLIWGIYLWCLSPYGINASYGFTRVVLLVVTAASNSGSPLALPTYACSSTCDKDLLLSLPRKH